jgi:hypothetical protein
MSLNSQAAGARGTIELGDKTYAASPLDVEEGMLLQNYCKSKLPTVVQAIANDPAFSKLPAKVQDMLLDKAVALQATGGGTPTEAAIVSVIQTTEGCRQFAWLCLNKNHPDVTPEKLAELITDQNAQTVCMKLLRATGLTEGPLGN